MKALVKVKEGPGNLELLDWKEPEAGPDMLVVEMKYAGICGTDLHIYHGTYQYNPPVVLGHEFSGVVAEVKRKIGGKVLLYCDE